jgi:HD-GYP domain-containing protein (c-di-GMP phosphodiesterase class II)
LDPEACTSGGFPISRQSLRLGELIATFALAQDNAFGQPLESQLRSCLLATWIGEEAGVADELRDTIYWVALLRYIGCTGHAHEVATVFGDEIKIRAQTLVHDAGDPEEVMRDVIRFATATQSPEGREDAVAALVAGAPAWARYNFASGCEVGDVLVRRLGFGAQVREALEYTFERWNGNGFPSGSRGTQIPRAMRIVHLSHDMEAIARRLSPDAAVAAAGDRRDRTYDPELSDLFVEHGAAWLEQLDGLEPWDAVLDLEPVPHTTLDGADLDDALSVAADFIDLKSPYMAGHSRRCARLAERAGRELGLADDAITTLRRAALVHEFGTTAVPNSIWDKPGTLTRAEFERVEVHPLITEQMLRRSPGLAILSPIASAHHEKPDGSGYHKHLGGDALDPGAQVLAAVDVYVGLTAERADRPAFTVQDAARELRRLASQGLLAHDATEAVLAAAGHAPPVTPGSSAPIRPGGLTMREVEVLHLAARGLTTREIADRLYISPKTADHHIQHVYTKIGVSTRAAAALWAMQNGVVS